MHLYEGVKPTVAGKNTDEEYVGRVLTSPEVKCKHPTSCGNLFHMYSAVGAAQIRQPSERNREDIEREQEDGAILDLPKDQFVPCSDIPSRSNRMVRGRTTSTDVVVNW